VDSLNSGKKALSRPDGLQENHAESQADNQRDREREEKDLMGEKEFWNRGSAR
jgi:hypothetical protein